MYLSSRTCLILATILLGTFSTGIPVASGQSDAMDEFSRAIANGVQAIEMGEPGRATEHFEQVFIDSTSYVDPDHGPVAYWYGRSLERTGDLDEARFVYRSGVRLLQSRDRVYPRLVDRYVHRVFGDQDSSDYDRAADAYQRMIEGVGQKSLPEAKREREVLAEHLRHLSLILDEGVRKQAGLSSEQISLNELSSVKGDVLARWWRRADPLPVTPSNERLREHLRRVAHARAQYPHPDDNGPPFFDVRGDIYVRLGEPDEVVKIRWNDSRLTDRVYSPGGIHLTLSDFPENEFWSYGSLDRSTYYIFMRNTDGEPFQIGTVEDVLPRELRDGYARGGDPGSDFEASGRSTRQEDRVALALLTLRTIYRHYAPFHPNMRSRYNKLTDYMMGAKMDRGGWSANAVRSPPTFVRRTIARDRNRDAEAARLREKRTPQEASSIPGEAAPFEVAVRVARFLHDDGTTRTEVYWAPEKQGLQLGEDQIERLEEEGFERGNEYFLQLTGIQETPDYRHRAVSRDRYRVQTGEAGGAVIPPQTFVPDQGDSTLYHLNLQWDQYPISTQGDSLGPKVQIATARRDSLQPLSESPGRPRMSDLKPLLLDGEEVPTDGNTTPFPFERINAKLPLYLYFEVYDLFYGEDDRTNYTVKYTVKGKADQGAISGLFGDPEERKTEVAITNQGSRRNTKEYIRLDLDDLDLESGSEVSIVIRVIDEVSGRQAKRRIDFQWNSLE